jgi:chorismate dehydratase
MKIKVGAVSYLNTKPMLVGLTQSPMSAHIELLLDHPAALARLIRKGEIDIGLLPVGALRDLGSYSIITDYCIGTIEEVASVAVFSEVPMEKIETVVLDYQSRTSVLLCQLLFKKWWKKDVRFIKATGDSYLEEIKGNTAGLIIGDRALSHRKQCSFIYDLGTGWKQMTGLPFVFAVWVAKETPEAAFLDQFNDAVGYGIQQIESASTAEVFSDYNLYTYFTKNISYQFDQDKKVGLQLFLEEINQLEILETSN